jgi:hypothetical protein
MGKLISNAASKEIFFAILFFIALGPALGMHLIIFSDQRASEWGLLLWAWTQLAWLKALSFKGSGSLQYFQCISETLQ